MLSASLDISLITGRSRLVTHGRGGLIIHPRAFTSSAYFIRKHKHRAQISVSDSVIQVLPGCTPKGCSLGRDPSSIQVWWKSALQVLFKHADKPTNKWNGGDRFSVVEVILLCTSVSLYIIYISVVNLYIVIIYFSFHQKHVHHSPGMNFALQ